MLLNSIITTLIAIMAIYLSVKLNDEVFRVAMGVAAIFCSILTICIAPWLLKLAIVLATPIVVEKILSY